VVAVQVDTACAVKQDGVVHYRGSNPRDRGTSFDFTQLPQAESTVTVTVGRVTSKLLAFPLLCPQIIWRAILAMVFFAMAVSALSQPEHEVVVKEKEVAKIH
jgi:hypothetical protein